MLSCSTVSKPTVEDHVATNIKTLTSRAWKFKEITATRFIVKLKFYFKKEVSGNLLTFRDGDPVMMKFGDTWKRAEVVTPHSNPRSYVVVDMNTDHTKETEIS